MSPVLYRPHRGSLADSIRLIVEVNNFPQLVRHMRREVTDYYPREELPTEENTKLELYVDGPDPRIGWDKTWIVLVKGKAWGFTNGPLLPGQGKQRQRPTDRSRSTPAQK